MNEVVAVISLVIMSASTGIIGWLAGWTCRGRREPRIIHRLRVENARLRAELAERNQS